jgi:hypothetical protein
VYIYKKKLFLTDLDTEKTTIKVSPSGEEILATLPIVEGRRNKNGKGGRERGNELILL